MKPAQKDAWIPSYLTTASRGNCEQFYGSYQSDSGNRYWAKLTNTILPSEIISFKTI